MSEFVAIRRATADDYLGMCSVLNALDELHRNRLPWLFAAPATTPRLPEYFAEFLGGARSLALVADAGSVVGVALGLLRETPEFPIFRRETFGVIDSIAVDPRWRRRSVGTRLAHEVEAWARTVGAAWVELGVYDFNLDALRFYESLGFESVYRKFRKPMAPAG